MSNRDADGAKDDSGTPRFEYLVIANCEHCGQEVKYTEEFENPVALDRGVSIKWSHCPYCGNAPTWWDVTEEYEIDRVLPTQERENQ